MNILGKKKYIYFLISGLIIVPGIISLILFGLNMSIDFTGGSRLTFSFNQAVDQNHVKTVEAAFQKENIHIQQIETTKNTIFIRSKPLDQNKDSHIINSIKSKYSDFKQTQFETVGPVIGVETTLNAVKGMLVASGLIVLYITWSFRKVPKPASSFKFGISAILALVHDVLVLIGVFSILGHFFNVEIDSLFVTAVLTVIGFSVHDTIVVFDRIRENLKRFGGESFEKIVNDSILQTLDRSLNTSLTVVLVLLALLLFGGDSIRWFVVALLIGIVSGTFSSIFNAAPLLVVWQEFTNKRLRGK